MERVLEEMNRVVSTGIWKLRRRWLYFEHVCDLTTFYPPKLMNAKLPLIVVH